MSRVIIVRTNTSTEIHTYLVRPTKLPYSLLCIFQALVNILPSRSLTNEYTLKRVASIDASHATSRSFVEFMTALAALIRTGGVEAPSGSDRILLCAMNASETIHSTSLRAPLHVHCVCLLDYVQAAQAGR